MRRAETLAIVMLATGLISGGTAYGQGLFVGEQDFDTADEALLGEVLDHCERLARDAPDADVAMQFTQSRAEETPAPGADSVVEPDDEATETLSLSIALDAVTSSDGNGGEDADNEAAPAWDQDAVTLEACKEAGLIF